NFWTLRNRKAGTGQISHSWCHETDQARRATRRACENRRVPGPRSSLLRDLICDACPISVVSAKQPISGICGEIATRQPRIRPLSLGGRFALEFEKLIFVCPSRATRFCASLQG